MLFPTWGSHTQVAGTLSGQVSPEPCLLGAGSNCSWNEFSRRPLGDSWGTGMHASQCMCATLATVTLRAATVPREAGPLTLQ